MDVSTVVMVQLGGVVATIAGTWATVRAELRHQRENHAEHVRRDDESHKDHEGRIRDLEKVTHEQALRLRMTDDTAVIRMGQRERNGR